MGAVIHGRQPAQTLEKSFASTTNAIIILTQTPHTPHSLQPGQIRHTFAFEPRAIIGSALPPKRSLETRNAGRVCPDERLGAHTSKLSHAPRTKIAIGFGKVERKYGTRVLNDIVHGRGAH